MLWLESGFQQRIMFESSWINYFVCMWLLLLQYTDRSIFCLYCFFPPCWFNFWICKIFTLLKSQNYIKCIHIFSILLNKQNYYTTRHFSFIHTDTYEATNSQFLVCNLDLHPWSKKIISLCSLCHFSYILTQEHWEGHDFYP